MFNNILVTFNFIKKLSVNVEVKWFLRAKFEGLQCPQLSGTISTKITLTSNTGEGHNILVHGIREVIIFYADLKGGS